MLNQTRISHSIEGNNGGSLCPPYVKIHVSIFNYCFGNSSSHFLEMTMLVRKVDTLLDSLKE